MQKPRSLCNVGPWKRRKFQIMSMMLKTGSRLTVEENESVHRRLPRESGASLAKRLVDWSELTPFPIPIHFELIHCRLLCERLLCQHEWTPCRRRAHRRGRSSPGHPRWLPTIDSNDFSALRWPWHTSDSLKYYKYGEYERIAERPTQRGQAPLWEPRAHLRRPWRPLKARV